MSIQSMYGGLVDRIVRTTPDMANNLSIYPFSLVPVIDEAIQYGQGLKHPMQSNKYIHLSRLAEDAIVEIARFNRNYALGLAATLYVPIRPRIKVTPFRPEVKKALVALREDTFKPVKLRLYRPMRLRRVVSIKIK